MESLELETVLGNLSICDYDIRVAIVKEKKGYLALCVVARRLDQEETPAEWTRYEYGKFLFMRGRIQGIRLAEWFRNREGSFQDHIFSVPVDSHMYVHHVPSNVPYGCITLDVPSVRFTTRITEGSSVERGRPLIADGCPYFPNFQAATLELLYGFTENDSASPEQVVIVWPARDAYLASVQSHPLSISVQVEGTLSKPATLHVYSRQPNLHYATLLGAASRVDVPLPAGGGGEVHVVLARETSLIDRMIIDSSTHHNVNLQDPASILALIAQGENVRLELKCKFPDHHDKWLKTIAAFANREGGVLIFGVDPEDGHPVGVPGSPNDFETTVSNQISTRVDPAVDPDIHIVHVQGKPLVVVKTPRGNQRPYGLVMKNGDHVSRKYFYRVGSSSFEAAPEHIRSAVLDQVSTGPGGPNHF